jgi:hypothetical protein
VESDGRFWPQARIDGFSTGEYQVVLGAGGTADVGGTFVVHVVDASGTAEAQISDYFVQLSHPSGAQIRSTGINFSRSGTDFKPVKQLHLVRRR